MLGGGSGTDRVKAELLGMQVAALTAESHKTTGEEKSEMEYLIDCGCRAAGR